MARTTKQSRASIADIVSDLEENKPAAPARKKTAPASTTVSGRRRSTTTKAVKAAAPPAVAGDVITINTGDLWIGSQVMDLCGPGAHRFFTKQESRVKFGFPEPLFTLRSGPVFSGSAVKEWWTAYGSRNQSKLEAKLAATRAQLAQLEADAAKLVGASN